MAKTDTVLAQDAIAVIESFAPRSLAFSGDPVGLQVGRLNKPVHNIWLALDASPDVIEQAVGSQADLLITHHALLFRPLSRVDTSTVRGQAVAKALAHDLCVYSAHTNLDVADGGVNDVLAQLLGLRDVEILDRVQNERLRKLVVFVPESHHQEVMDAVCAAGAGHIGNYSSCTFNTPGQGTFLPLQGTNPFIGEAGKLERVQEVRLETVVPESKIEDVVRAMLSAHPYEEVAYDLYPLEIMGKAYGIGRVGQLPEPMRLLDFAKMCRAQLQLQHIRFGGAPDMNVRRVAVLGGSGGKWVHQAIAMGADVLVTSDTDHHLVAEAWQDGLAIVDATHSSLERPVLTRLKTELEQHLGERVSVTIANVNEDPYHWV
ncbi:Nif3-like dinuclear metal center hexameric protein [Alicyclobacillus tolerans]|uniref:Nif3-like dinuclear metal center hexameric protein n=1 Tax=Alicyclobacillus tolerans TaxID=90970 RepID=UPI001F006037|nr:Nif3-like dinuclear metal center hexameric protein [Alicyclobacillus tolerans]MCF8563352.1 Nif3-like dinuclear metal center hexameric protein [Alicyclobacillus tolerans]